MISKKFAAIPDERLEAFIREGMDENEPDNIVDSVVSISDLWILKNMKQSLWSLVASGFLREEDV